MDPNVLCSKKTDKLNHSLDQIPVQSQCTPSALPPHLIISAPALQYTSACANVYKQFNIQWTWYAHTYL